MRNFFLLLVVNRVGPAEKIGGRNLNGMIGKVF
jgi:hypothetical protein